MYNCNYKCIRLRRLCLRTRDPLLQSDFARLKYLEKRIKQVQTLKAFLVDQEDESGVTQTLYRRGSLRRPALPSASTLVRLRGRPFLTQVVELDSEELVLNIF